MSAYLPAICLQLPVNHPERVLGAVCISSYSNGCIQVSLQIVAHGKWEMELFKTLFQGFVVTVISLETCMESII